MVRHKPYLQNLFVLIITFILCFFLHERPQLIIYESEKVYTTVGITYYRVFYMK